MNESLLYFFVLSIVIIILVILISVSVTGSNSTPTSDNSTTVSTTETQAITSDMILLNPKLDIETVEAPAKIEIPVTSEDTQNTWKIPKRIYQTQKYSQVPIRMAEAMQKIIAMNPEFGYKYYDDFQVHNFMVKYMDSRIVQAYDLLIPGAFKADLFRYCLLYTKGGIYIDSDFTPVRPLQEYLYPNDEFVAPIDSPVINSQGYLTGVYNAFIACTPEHPILGEVIDLVTDRIHRGAYGIDALYLTGPLALGEVFLRRYQVETLVEQEYEPGVRLLNHQPGRVMCKNEIIFQTKYPEYDSDMQKYRNNSHYGDLWKQNLCLKDRPVYIPPGFNYNSNCPNCLGWTKKEFPNIPPKYRKTIIIDPYTPASIKGRSQRIPLKIHQTNTYSYVPVEMFNAMESIISMNPEYSHHYYDLKTTRKYIQTHLGDRAIKCFDSLVPGAYKADFFRYTVLYIEGGIYLDSGCQAVTRLRKLVRSSDEFISSVDNGSSGIQNGFIAACPGHPILGRVLQLVMDRIERRDYGRSDLYPTGPIALGDAFVDIVGAPVAARIYPSHIRLIEYSFQDGCNSGRIHDGRIDYFYNKYPSYRLDATWYNPTPHYSKLWDQRKVYSEF